MCCLERVTHGGDAGEVVLGSGLGCMDGGVADAEKRGAGLRRPKETVVELS